jgi:ankyrin repeat protein
MIKGNKATTKLLLSVDNLNADILDTGGQTPLSHAAELGLGDIIQLLLDLNADINLEDKYRQTPLLWVTQEGHETIVSELLASAGINVDHSDSNGYAALSYAAELGYASIMQTLISTYIYINSEDNIG